MELSVMAARLSNEIERKGISKKDFGVAIGASDVMVSYWCNGKRVPSLQQVVDMAEYLGVSVDYLVGLSDYPNRAPSLADDLGLSDLAVANMRSIASADDRRELLNKLLQFSGLSSVFADISMAYKLRREAPGNIRTTHLTDEIKAEVDKAGYVLLDNQESADYREQQALMRLKWAFMLSDGRRFQ